MTEISIQDFGWNCKIHWNDNSVTVRKGRGRYKNPPSDDIPQEVWDEFRKYVR